MLLEEYEWKSRSDEIKRSEDLYCYGYELYRVGAPGSYLVQLCVGAYGFKSKEDALNAAHKMVDEYLMDKETGSLDMFSVYAKLYKMDLCREVIKESITLEKIQEGSIDFKRDCMEKIRAGITDFRESA